MTEIGNRFCFLAILLDVRKHYNVEVPVWQIGSDLSESTTKMNGKRQTATKCKFSKWKSPPNPKRKLWLHKLGSHSSAHNSIFWWRFCFCPSQPIKIIFVLLNADQIDTLSKYKVETNFQRICWKRHQDKDLIVFLMTNMAYAICWLCSFKRYLAYCCFISSSISKRICRSIE